PRDHSRRERAIFKDQYPMSNLIAGNLKSQTRNKDQGSICNTQLNRKIKINNNRCCHTRKDMSEANILYRVSHQ
ncbi:MAG TPA: hypothetical protein PLZ62_03370, partial [bacterium]|nr:hypothetical protein [bacterium]